MRLEGPFDQPTCVKVSQSVAVMDRHRTGTARAILFRQMFPHSWIDRAVRVGIENAKALKHGFSPLQIFQRNFLRASAKKPLSSRLRTAAGLST